MEGTNFGGEGGWMREAYVNMTQSGATCPQGLDQRDVGSQVLCIYSYMNMDVMGLCFTHQ